MMLSSIPHWNDFCKRQVLKFRSTFHFSQVEETLKIPIFTSASPNVPRSAIPFGFLDAPLVCLQFFIPSPPSIFCFNNFFSSPGPFDSAEKGKEPSTTTYPWFCYSFVSGRKDSWKACPLTSSLCCGSFNFFFLFLSLLFGVRHSRKEKKKGATSNKGRRRRSVTVTLQHYFFGQQSTRRDANEARQGLWIIQVPVRQFERLYHNKNIVWVNYNFLVSTSLGPRLSGLQPIWRRRAGPLMIREKVVLSESSLSLLVQ